ncbi:MAG: hypothetical protein EOP04_15065 [Proteobacteria bacterium]|nr:MAG: hypothetical protein EOP04_15065 [Pseudomonadota bacterium]
MLPIEAAFEAMQSTNSEMMQKRWRGEILNKEDKAQLKECMKAIHIASAEVEIEELVGYFDRYEIGLGLGYIEPSYERINYAFAWMEARDGDFEGDDDF